MNAGRVGRGARIAVLLPAPLEGPLDYAVPEGVTLGRGDLVEVELGARRLIGAVWGEGAGDIPAARLKPVIRRLDLPPLRAPMRRFLGRAADYTLTPPGLMLRLAIRVPDLGKPARFQTLWQLSPKRPARMTPERARVIAALESAPDTGLTTTELARSASVSSAVVRGLADAAVLVPRAVPAHRPYPPLFGQAPGKHLNEVQAAAATHLRRSVERAAFDAVLLKGVTGSGKTEVYLEAVAQCIAAGRQALVLVPEVALTHGFLSRVEARFGARPAEWHHGVTGAERRRLWLAAADGDVALVVGARSALFLPFRDLGLIVVDEEHDQSYKQEDSVLYNARDMAVLRAKIEGAVAVLASATPSLESWVNAKGGKYTRLDLPERFGAAQMPGIDLIDLRRDQPGRDRWLAEPLVEAARARLERGEQVLFFLNRRGYAPLTLCRACGQSINCPDCDAWMVTHRLRGHLLCHQCGREAAIPAACPHCGETDRLAVCGPGVERIGEEAAQLFPTARIEILSSDLASGPGELRRRLAAIAEGEADIVIGTQMVAKGHNFPLLTLVGVIDADLGLHGGDLRAAERTFQLLHQVSGRAGRTERPGAVLIQTASPDHPVMRAILSGEAEAFWRAEAEARFEAGSPPFGRMAGVILSGEDSARLWDCANALAAKGHILEAAGATLYGPAPAPIARIRGRHRVRLLVKAPKDALLQPALRSWRDSVKISAAVRLTIDIDPQSFL